MGEILQIQVGECGNRVGNEVSNWVFTYLYNYSEGAV